ncbi:MAG: hypothetical protein ACNA8K_10195 [Cyclonatronaceae bacterium]
MQIFRNPYSNRYISIVLFIGWLAMLLPTKYELRNFEAFTYWLNQHVSVTNGQVADQKIREIRLFRSDFQSVVNNAADVISRNSDLFDLPFDSSDDPDILATRLMAAFTQTSDTGMNENSILSVFNAKHYLTTKSIDLSWTTLIIPSGKSAQRFFEQFTNGIPAGIPAFLLSPLISGISIGAP